MKNLISKTDFAGLEKELYDNERKIVKLQNRNEQIKNVFNSLQALIAAPRTLTGKKPSIKKGRLKSDSMSGRVMEVLKHGSPMNVTVIAREVFHREPTRREIDSVANICSQLARLHGKTRRVSRATYQTNFPEIQKHTAHIGTDTRVTQIGKPDLLPEMQPSREREIVVIKKDNDGGEPGSEAAGVVGSGN